MVKHELASDEYYEWYLNHDCPHGTVVQFVWGNRPGQCRARLEPGDQRELIHVGEWRRLTPSLCLRQRLTRDMGLQMGRETLKAAAEASKQQEARGPRLGTGLDDAVEQAKATKPEERGRDLLRRRDRPSPERDAKKRRSVVEIMHERALSRAGSDQDGQRGKLKKDKKKKRSNRRRRSRSRRRKAKSLEDPSSSSTESSKSSPSDFHSTSARGGELWRVAEKKPGRLAQISLDEVTRYLAGRNEMGGAENHWRGEKVLAYLNQVILGHHSAGQVGIRNQRELSTSSWRGITCERWIC